MMRSYFRNWNFVRIVRLAMGILVVIEGYKASEWMFILLGLVIALMPLFNVGCCATSSCYVPKYAEKVKEEDITYEEVK